MNNKIHNIAEDICRHGFYSSCQEREWRVMGRDSRLKNLNGSNVAALLAKYSKPKEVVHEDGNTLTAEEEQQRCTAVDDLFHLMMKGGLGYSESRFTNRAVGKRFCLKIAIQEEDIGSPVPPMEEVQ